jgi:hypothetical protein
MSRIQPWHTQRNRYVAEELQTAGFVTVLADLLTPAEEIADGPPCPWVCSGRAPGPLPLLSPPPSDRRRLQEPGALEQVARLARDRFIRHISPTAIAPDYT